MSYYPLDYASVKAETKVTTADESPSSVIVTFRKTGEDDYGSPFSVSLHGEWDAVERGLGRALSEVRQLREKVGA